jgi:hypothetical protein
LAHWSYPDIADIQGVSVPTVRDRIERAIQHRIPDETRNQMRKMEGDRLDRLQKMNQLIIDSSSTTVAEKQKAQDAFLAVQARRARLFGLDMPVKLDVKYSDSLDNEIEALMGQLAPGSTAPEPEPEPQGTSIPWETPEP